MHRLLSLGKVGASDFFCALELALSFFMIVLVLREEDNLQIVWKLSLFLFLLQFSQIAVVDSL